MPKIKPPEFEDRPAIAEPDPEDRLFPPGARYTLDFKLVSMVSGVFALLARGVLSPVVTSSHSLGDLPLLGAGTFCTMVYFFLQIACCWQQRHGPRTRRARVYLWLLALLPLWVLPVGYVLSTLIIQADLYVARNY